MQKGAIKKHNSTSGGKIGRSSMPFSVQRCACSHQQALHIILIFEVGSEHA